MRLSCRSLKWRMFCSVLQPQTQPHFNPLLQPVQLLSREAKNIIVSTGCLGCASRSLSAIKPISIGPRANFVLVDSIIITKKRPRAWPPGPCLPHKCPHIITKVRLFFISSYIFYVLVVRKRIRDRQRDHSETHIKANLIKAEPLRNHGTKIKHAWSWCRGLSLSRVVCACDDLFDLKVIIHFSLRSTKVGTESSDWSS